MEMTDEELEEMFDLFDYGTPLYGILGTGDEVPAWVWACGGGGLLAAALAIILGNEIEGVQEGLLPLCDGCLEIPQYGTKHSLNVSCAAAIVIWEMFKQLRVKSYD